MSTAVSVTNASVTFALRRVAGRISVLVYADTNKASSYFQLKGAQWLSGRVLASRPRAAGSSLTGVTALWSLRKTHLS